MATPTTPAALEIHSTTAAMELGALLDGLGRKHATEASKTRKARTIKPAAVAPAPVATPASATELNPAPFMSANFKKNYGFSGENPCFLCNKDAKQSTAVALLLETGFLTSVAGNADITGPRALCAKCAKAVPAGFVFDVAALATPEAAVATRAALTAAAMAAPTRAQFTAYNALFDYFNAELFAGALPACLLNLSRKAKAHGFFAPNRWLGAGTEGEAMHEISLNPDSLAREPRAVLGTLVHEMAHLQRQVTGKPPRGGYHCSEWAEMMLAVGLTPVSFDNPGKMTGQKVSHEIEESGAFALAFARMPTEYLLPFTHVPAVAAVAKKSTSNKVKYVCAGCDSKVWGKPGLLIGCKDCEEEYEEQA